MTTKPLSVEVANLEPLKARLSDPALIAGPLKDLLTSASLTAEGVAKNTAPHDTGQLKRDLRSEVKPLKARVFTSRNLTYYTVMELGRAKGAKPPPKAALAGWASRHGWDNTLFFLARSIGDRGIKGRFFMKAGADAARARMPGLLAAMGAAIGVKFGKPL